MGSERPARRLLDVEGRERDLADLDLALLDVQGGVLQDAEDPIRVRAQLLGRGARDGRIGEGGEQEQRRGERADQAMTLIRA